MKKLTKILSILLAVALVCTGLVLAVSANESTNETASYVTGGTEATGTLVEALSAADENTTVKLLGDCTLEETFTVTKSVTVDLNGYKLVAKADAFAIGASDVQFMIVGEGSIDLAGKLVSAAADYVGFTVTVAGTEMTDGIAITHSASNIITTYHGTWNFKNLDVVTTSAIKGGYKASDGTYVDADSYFKTVLSDDSTAELYFDAVKVNATKVAYTASTGNFVVSIGGSGSVYINNSAFYTQNSGIYAGNELGGSPLTGSISIVNSTISCLANNNLTSRNYVILGMDSNFATGVDTDPLGFNGSVSIEYSTVECNTRLFTFGSADAAEVNISESTVRLAGNYGKDNAYSMYRGAGSLNFGENCRFISAKSGIFSAPPIGTRVNVDTAVKLAEGTKLLYDPVADPEAPYLVVDEYDERMGPDFYKDFGFDTISFTNNYNASTHTGDRVLYNNKTSTKMWTSSDRYWHDATGKGGMQWDNKLGVIEHVQSAQGNYAKWYVPESANPGKTNVSLSNSNNTDTYLIMGIDSNGHKTVDGYGYHPTAMSGDYRKSVVVSEFEFATEKDGLGYPYFTIQAQARNASNSSKSAGTVMGVNHAGEVINTTALQDKPDVMPKLNAKGEWNRLSMVCYSDPAVDKYQVYVFLNGEYMGWINLSNYVPTGDDYVWFQGARLNFSNSSQWINSPLLIDNVSVRAYVDYQVEGEYDGGEKYPAQYINGTPTNRFVNSSIEVAGRTFSDINEALTYATTINAKVELYSDMDIEVTANGIIDTNGYDVNIVGDSYGYVADGNLIEFSDKYQFTAYFYTGDKNKLNADYVFDAADFESVVVKVGDYLDKEMVYTEEAVKNFTDKTVSGSQSGWATAIGSTESVLPITNVTLDYVNGAGENKAIYYYPIFGVVPMAYYVTDATGTVYAGDVSNEQALIDFQALKGGDTFVLQSDVNISKAGTTFANTTDTTEQVINIDLNGNTLSLSEEGILVNVGSYTTLNVYSTVAGGVVNCVTNTAGTLVGNYAFAINDPSVTSFTSPDLVENVKSAKINVGTIAALGTDGANMTIYAEMALLARVGDDDCRIVSDGVDIYSPTYAIANRGVIDTQLYNGEVYVKNSLIVGIVRDCILNVAGFYKTKSENGSTAHKPDKDAEGNEIELSNRQPGFENTIMTSYLELENCIIINKLSGLSDGNNNNIVGNNGDGNNSRKNIVLKNVVTTGRLNPSNSNRTAFDGFVVAEHFDVSSKYGATLNGTAIGTYTAPMAFNAIDLGIKTEDGVHTVIISYYDAETDRMVEAVDYKIANNGVSGVEGAYVLPMLTKGTDYESNFVTVSWKNVAGDDNVATSTFIKGSKFVNKTGLNAGSCTEGLVTFTHDGTWSAAPEYVTENVDIIPGYTAKVNVSGIKANVSLYSDFDINVYIPAEYADSIILNGYEWTDVTLDGVAYKKVTVTQACNETTNTVSIAFTVKTTARGNVYTANKVINYSVAKYASAVLASEATTNADKVLAYYMAKYANAASAYINGAEDTVLADMLAANAAYGEIYTANNGYDNAIADTQLSGVFTEATVTLAPKPAFVFTTKAGFVGTVTVRYADGTNTRVYNIDAATKRDIVIEGMMAANFNQVLEITAEGTIGEEAVAVTGTYSLETFAKYHSENQEDPASVACLPLVNALRAYAEVAKLYVEGTLGQ
ncbi:MAG: hypothetical protein E7673_00910 [Ruminococcaceae bacterium]|nr:hypothetical protein [Oscillospiraceae bacterium]